MGKEARKSIKQYTKEVVQEDWYNLLEKKVKRWKEMYYLSHQQEDT